jgi:hypothetical protein
MKYELKATQAQSIDDNWEYYRYISFGCDIITNIFQQRDLKLYKNIIKIMDLFSFILH